MACAALPHTCLYLCLYGGQGEAAVVMVAVVVGLEVVVIVVVAGGCAEGHLHEGSLSEKAGVARGRRKRKRRLREWRGGGGRGWGAVFGRAGLPRRRWMCCGRWNG